jgi:hypothetical protein
MNKAAEKRYAGIKAVSDVVADGRGNLVMTEPSEIAALIRDLAPLGRTDRWKDAIEAWASLVEDQEDEKGLRWAFFQGGIWAGHEAE